MIIKRTFTLNEFKEKYGFNPELLLNIQKNGVILFHPHYETLEEILFFDFVLTKEEITFKEMAGVVNKNPLFEVYKEQKAKMNNHIGYNPYKKDTAVLETEG